MALWPTREQWQRWTLPSKLTVLGFLVAVFGVLLSILIPLMSASKAPTLPEPALACLLEPDGDYLKFSVTNEGAITALSVPVDHFTLRYDTADQRVRATLYDLSHSGRPGFRWMYLPRLEPNETKSMRAGESVAPVDGRWIHALVFDLSFLREPDRKSFRSLCTFFSDGGRLSAGTDFSSSPHHAKLSAEIDQVVARVRATRQPMDMVRESTGGGG